MKKIVLIPALLAASLAFAQDYKYEISPMIGYNVAEGNLGMKDNGYYVGGVEAQMNFKNTNWSPELSAFYTKSADQKAPSTTNSNILRVAANGVYSFSSMGSVVPFAKIGLGYEAIKRRTPAMQNGVFLDAGAGAKIALTDHLALKLEAIYMAKGNSNNAGNADSNLLTLAGITFAFGGDTPKPAPVMAAAVVPMVDGDDDNDGVANSVDQCIYTPANTPVDMNGCALDDDKDGVANNLDQCPQTAFGVEVDENGCKLNQDNDNDGVLNENDLCPTTPAGDRVNSDGCTEIVNLHVNFDYDSAVVKQDSMQNVNAFAEFLKKHTNYNAYIVGYTDSVASAGYNKKLSLKRAEAIVEELIAQGVEARRIASVGMGEDNPIADNSTEDGRAQNRRIEAELIKR